MAKVTVNYSTEHYVKTHGKQPRGTGQWQFELEFWGAPNWAYRTHGTYAEARKDATRYARQECKEQGCKRVDLYLEAE